MFAWLPTHKTGKQDVHTAAADAHCIRRGVRNTPTSCLSSAVISRLQKAVQLRNAHLCQRPRPHPVQRPIRTTPPRLLQVKLPVRAHSCIHTVLQKVVDYHHFCRIYGVCLLSLPDGVIGRLQLEALSPLCLDHRAASATWPLQQELSLLQSLEKWFSGPTPGNRLAELLPYVALNRFQEPPFENTRLIFLSPHHKHYLTSRSNELWLSLSSLSQTDALFFVHFSSAPRENMIHSPSSQWWALGAASVGFTLDAWVSSIPPVTVAPMAVFHDVSATWWQCYIQHSYVKMMDTWPSTSESLPPLVSEWRSANHSRTLLTGNLDYDQSLTAYHFFLFLHDGDITNQLCSCP